MSCLEGKSSYKGKRRRRRRRKKKKEVVWFCQRVQKIVEQELEEDSGGGVYVRLSGRAFISVNVYLGYIVVGVVSFWTVKHPPVLPSWRYRLT